MMRSLFDRCSFRVGMSTVPGVSRAHTEAAHTAHHHHHHHSFQPYNCLVDMELQEGLTGRLLDTHSIIFGEGFSDTLSSRIVGADGTNAYRPWEADPGDHRPPDHRLHPLSAVSSAPGPIQVLAHSPSVPPPVASSAQMSHYAHTIPTYSDNYPAGPAGPHPPHPPHHVGHPQHPVPHKLPPFAAFSPDRSVGSTTPSPLPSFNTLPSPHARYPLVPAPVQAREIPTIQQQMMDERHIRMFESPQGSDPAPSSTTPAQASPNTQPPTVSSGSASSCSSGSSNSTNSNSNASIAQQQQSTYDGSSTLLRLEGSVRVGVKRAGRAGSLESSESDASVSGTENSGQVSSISSSAVNNNENNGGSQNNMNSSNSVPCSEGGFRPPPPQQPPPPQDDPPEKPVKKKRKRCGDCVGCQRKDNCGDCAPCRNDKSHQICKMRRCDKLTEKRTPRGEKWNADKLEWVP
ncbi:methylcytosine dioxygenase TET-like isoform X2 [Macrobrachium nipponense]|uniref:methylcytosine dioxygenase TET-like isoform X2 n=1 Tax=Macrobrachium nipponense TaxID=159736 RepID=UPI0030C7D77C